MKELKFTHIPKTAGQTILVEASRHDILYSKKDPWFKRENLSAWARRFHNVNDYWHQPIYRFEKSDYREFDWFTVIRDPVERALSAFHCEWKGWSCEGSNPSGWRITPTKADLNRWTLNHIWSMKSCHYWPQHKFVFDDHGEQVVKHVLRYRDLPTAMNELWESYGIPARITEDRESYLGRPRMERMFNRNDFWVETIAEIKKVYERDYEMMEVF